jgi:hypothetical protein
VFLPSGRDGFEGMGVMFNAHKDIKYFGFVLFLFADKNSTAVVNAQALDVSRLTRNANYSLQLGLIRLGI